MSKKLIEIACRLMIIVIGGCNLVTEYEYQQYLDNLPATPRDHNDEAISIVMKVYGIVSPRPDVRWVVQERPLVLFEGGAALGMTQDCVSWVWWPPFYGDDPEHQTTKSYSHTVMAHEIAHCALWLYTGDGDADHSDPEWWGPSPPPPGQEANIGGLVGIAMRALEDDGL